ncbi:MAG TPA: hypothetical protein VL978_11700 [Puia sp.]|nr:hypothetical protein [Puia sp.]
MKHCIPIRPRCLAVVLGCCLILPPAAFSQSPACTDIKSGTFIYFVKSDGSKIVSTRTADEQREFNASAHQTVIWEIHWISDCSYVLAYNSGLEDASRETQQLVKRHKFVNTITSVTPDYYIVQTSLDKPSNPVVSADTMWIKQYRDAKNKLVVNPRADSLVALRKAAIDSVFANSATLYVFRPGKLTEWANYYTLYLDDAPICQMTNKSSYIVRLLKPGPANLHANIGKKETSLPIDIKPREKYYLRCDFPWGLNQSPKLTFVQKEEAAPYFDTIK